MTAPSAKKRPITVRTVGTITTGNFTGLARLLLAIHQKSNLKLVTNEQPSSTLSSQQQGPV